MDCKTGRSTCRLNKKKGYNMNNNLPNCWEIKKCGKEKGAFNLDEFDLLIVENLGNLVCPAEFDMGENLRVVVLSVTEGEDKPLKYPLMFRVCHAALLNKIDLLPHLDYDREAAVQNIRKVNPQMPIFEISARTEEGFDSWIEWLMQKLHG